MSVDFGYDVLIGFAIPEDMLFDQECGSRWSCEHAEALTAAAAAPTEAPRHCPECGKKIKEIIESWPGLKPEIAVLIEDVDEWYHVGWEGDLDGVGVQLMRYSMDSGEAYFVGVEVASFYHREDLGAQRGDVPQIPSKAKMAKFLKASGIPFDPDSWGLWKIGTAS